ncbi:MAG: hypothetical protein KJ638_08515, partial [Chloroflexi bacterium]|nr:hypothetical protein [Chloroflexota bacterium]
FSLFARIDTSAIKGILESPRFSLQNARDGLLLFNCEQSGLQYNIQVLDSVPSSDALVNFDNEIGLLSVDIESLAPRRYRMKCDWVALSPLESEPFMFAVSRLDGVENTRIVHLPSLAIFPTTSWPEGRVIREELVFQVPDDVPPGEYILLLGWYDSGNMFDFATDERSRVGEEVRVGNVSVP